MMSVIVAGSATELSCMLACFEQLELFVESIYENHYFLSESCRGSRLSVCLSEHRNVFPLFSILIELCDEFFYLWNKDIIECFFDRERHAGVVDVL